MNENRTEQQDLVRAMVENSKGQKRVKKRFPTLTLDSKTLKVLGAEEREWRGRKVPRDADIRQILLTAYLGLVVNNEPFHSWATHLRKVFPEMEPEQGGNQNFVLDQLKKKQLLDAYAEGELASFMDALSEPEIEEYFERRRLDNLGDYETISNDIKYKRGLRLTEKSKYLCSRCGLHFLATTLFANASYGPRVTHQLVWDPNIAWIIGQTELGVFSIPDDSTGHGRVGMRLDTYEQVEAVAKKLFLQQIRHCTPQALAELFRDNPLKVKKELERARQVLGMQRRRGNQTRWGAPGEPCKDCRNLT